MVANELVAPPLGGLLFATAAAVPFLLDAGSFAAAAALVAAMGGRFRAERPEGSAPTTLRAEIAEGVRWLVRHRLLRILAVAIALMNLTLSATLSISVLYAQERLGLGSIGYGLLISSMAVGGIAASVVAERLIGWLGLGHHHAARPGHRVVHPPGAGPGPQPAPGRDRLRPVRLPRHDLERDQRVAAPGADPGPAAGLGQQRLRAVRLRVAVAGRGRRGASWLPATG